MGKKYVHEEAGGSACHDPHLRDWGSWPQQPMIGSSSRIASGITSYVHIPSDVSWTPNTEYCNIYVGQHIGRPRFRKLCQGFLISSVAHAPNAQGNEYLVGE